MKLAGKNIVVTGAKGGLGTFVTQALLEEGAQVIGVSRSISAANFPNERFIPCRLNSRVATTHTH